VRSYVDIGVQEGAKLVVDGPAWFDAGWFDVAGRDLPKVGFDELMAGCQDRGACRCVSMADAR